jgi:hypothetical protein
VDVVVIVVIGAMVVGGDGNRGEKAGGRVILYRSCTVCMRINK